MSSDSRSTFRSAARRRAEQRRVDGDAAAARRRDLAPARLVVWPVLTPKSAGTATSRSSQVCSVRPPAIVSVSSPTVSRTNRVRISDPRELRDVGCARVLAGRVEPVGADEMRVAQPELRGLGVHQRREGRVVRRDRERERVGGVVRRLDQRTLDQVADGELLAGVEVDRRLADRGGARVDGDDVGELEVLERDEHGHQLRDRRDRQPVVRVRRREHLARARVLDDVRACVDRRRAGARAARAATSGERSDEQQRASLDAGPSRR